MIIQEVDIATGRLLPEWRGLDHIPVTASNEPMAAPYDYLHVTRLSRSRMGTCSCRRATPGRSTSSSAGPAP